MAVGMMLVLGAFHELPAARKSGLPLGPLQAAGAIGGVLEFAGVGVIVMALTLRWVRPLQQTTPAPRAARAEPAISADPIGAETAALVQAIGPRSEKHAMSRAYNIRPWIVWGLIAFVFLALMCYLMLFVIQLPPEMVY